MGVTIHYSGTLSASVSAEALVQRASAFATEMGWEFESMGTSGALLTIFPHPDCEPLKIDPDENGTLQNWVKTQFSGAETHIKVVDFLSRIAPNFATLVVEDEAEYWETGNRETLVWHLTQVNDAIRELQRENPAAQIQVRTPDGRIIDMIS